MIIAGEASGDLHGARLVNAMRKRNRRLFFCGIGGQALKAAGVKILVDASELAVVGITEIFPKMPSIFKGIAIAKKTLKTLHPDLLILIDFPDFNLHIAATAKKLKIPILYYISPQVWAWRSGRVRKIGRLVDHVAVILPFEEEFFKKYQIPVTFVGHPLLDKHISSHNPAIKKQDGHTTCVGLLPGSRDREIATHLPVMLDAARIIGRRMKNIKFIVSMAPAVEREHVEAIIAKHLSLSDYELVAGGVDSIFERCRLVVAASGTVTLECAISGTPMVIIYKVSPVSYWLGKALIRVKHIGLVNLIAGKEIVPELLQHEASPKNIAKVVINMLSDDKKLDRLSIELSSIRNLLGGPGASKRVADIALNILYPKYS
ncbi:MAG: lipid-A-disaccharide synthase [Proteobacteria bacterium]|nr:lipid-A-disaccharide synthase [Pseudomonadota bacterium]